MIVRRRIRGETRGVITPAADPAFARHVAARREAGFTVNVNLLGEAILGDAEADRRLDALCARMSEKSAWSACSSTCGRPSKSRTSLPFATTVPAPTGV